MKFFRSSKKFELSPLEVHIGGVSAVIHGILLKLLVSVLNDLKYGQINNVPVKQEVVTVGLNI